jgi:membrane associated rhomboid family serine protease
MTAPATIIVLVITGAASLYAFQRPDIRERWIFEPRAILADREYHRMITCGLIHADWTHFFFNAISFFSFARTVEVFYGAQAMLVIYGSGILGGSVLSLLIHRHHEYRALGASGGVCGIIFASIFLLPWMSILVFPLPFGVPAYLYAVLFLAGSYVAHRRNAGNIGHDAHMGGAIVGLLAATAMYPRLVLAAPWMFAGVLGLSLIILWLLLAAPIQLFKWPSGSQEPSLGDERSRRYEQNSNRNKKLAEMDALLDQVAKGGVEKLSASERRRLEQLSKEIYGSGGPARER